MRDAAAWSFLGGLAWTAAVVSNLLYLGLLVIALHFVLLQAARMRALGASKPLIALVGGAWNLLAPVAYFAAVGYPATRSNPAYATTGLSFVRANLSYYRTSLAPTAALLAVYVVIVLATLAGALLATRRRDLFALALLGAAAATLLPALLQGRQRDVHYLAMPLLLVFSALGTGAREPALGGRVERLAAAALCLGLGLIFRQGADLRSYFVATPYGGQLAAFRSRVAPLTPPGGVICVRLDLDPRTRRSSPPSCPGPTGSSSPRSTPVRRSSCPRPSRAHPRRPRRSPSPPTRTATSPPPGKRPRPLVSGRVDPARGPRAGPVPAACPPRSRGSARAISAARGPRADRSRPRARHGPAELGPDDLGRDWRATRCWPLRESRAHRASSR